MDFLPLSRRRSSSRNVPGGQERGETDVFAGWEDEPILYETATKVISTINALFTNGHIVQMTYQCLSFGQNHQEYQRFTR